ncbi:DUF4247 domain-containing protein [Tumebacillus flagellatus]|uniref:DUF4247 domain-containing protein n=1 Tax=Tumebacillus flagellatus TaxID=1157490 RepID=A0A074LV52_9BACL|nr:DUF4247 domain-containing protein [Tumebacillus flagellatus]KEO84520.1 hypothetical protein EL26_03085 [Tumebacillus flagellatus]
MQRLTRTIALTLALTVFTVGCGMENSANFIKNQYALEDVKGSGDTQQKVYRAPGQTVPDVAKKIADEQKPDEMSKESTERMFLVYPQTLIHVQQDPNKKEDALIEVDTKEFVRQNYDPSFLNGFLAASLLSNIFGSGWRSYRGGGYTGVGYDPTYRGRTGGGTYTPPYTSPSRTTPSVKPPKSSSGTGRVIRKR